MHCSVHGCKREVRLGGPLGGGGQRCGPAMIRAVSTKAGWEKRETATQATHRADAAVLPPAVEALIRRAAHLSANEIVMLDRADRSGAQIRAIAWDLLRDVLDRDPRSRERRFATRNRSWKAVNLSAASAGLEPVLDDGYWRVVSRPAAGATRLARFAACALLAASVVDDEIGASLLEPWRSIVE